MEHDLFQLQIKDLTEAEYRVLGVDMYYRYIYLINMLNDFEEKQGKQWVKDKIVKNFDLRGMLSIILDIKSSYDLFKDKKEITHQEKSLIAQKTRGLIPYFEPFFEMLVKCINLSSFKNKNLNNKYEQCFDTAVKKATKKEGDKDKKSNIS